MKPHSRKTLQISDNPHEFSRRPPPSSGCNSTSLEQMTSPFDSSIGLTVLVLLTALFFLGFFSIFIRRFYDDHSPDVPPRRPLQSSLQTSRKGLDAAVVRSLPVYNYDGNAKYNQEDCAICLGGFEENDVVKVIPRCRHVFHVECIDKWLLARGSCPVCRGTQLFDLGGNAVGMEHKVDEGAGNRPTVENHDTCIDTGALSLRRTSSSSSIASCPGDRVALQRTSSFG